MERYKNVSRNSGVTSFEIHSDHIDVLFKDTLYTYDYSITGKKHVEKMKELAIKGKGLSTYITQNVREKFAAKKVL